MSLSFDWSFDSFGSKDFLSNGVSLWDEFRSGDDYVSFFLLQALSFVSFSGCVGSVSAVDLFFLRVLWLSSVVCSCWDSCESLP